MDDLLRRIEATTPNPIRLTNEEYAYLQAWVKMRAGIRPNQRRWTVAELSERAWQRKQEMRPYMLVLDYNRNLRALDAEQAAAPSPPQPAARAEVAIKGIPRCQILAHQSYKRALSAADGPSPEPLKQVWQWLRDHDPDGDYNLPGWRTWSRYLRAYRSHADASARTRDGGRSVARHGEL